MNAILPTQHSRKRRLIIITACLSAASAMAWISRDMSAGGEMISRTIAPQAVAATPDSRLGQLLLLDLPAHFAKPLAAAIAQVRLSSNMPDRWVAVGETLAQLQRDTGEMCYYDHAEVMYREALRLRPKTVSALVGMAWVTGGRHVFDESIRWANEALAVDAECVDAFGILGDAALELGDYEGAFQHYQQMMDLRPDLSSWSRGAQLLWVTGDASKAIALMGKAIAAGAPHAENTAWCRAKLATMLFQNGAMLPAKEAIQPCLNARSKNVHVLRIAAKLAEAFQDFATAKSHYEAMLSTPARHEALAGLGDLMAAQGKLNEAGNYYQQVEALHASHLKNGIHDHSFMAKFLADHERSLIEALRMAEEHKLTKNVHEADTLAWVYFKNGMLPQAMAAMKIALSQKTPDPEMHYHAGVIAAAFGDRISARMHLEKAVSLNAKFHLIHGPLSLKALGNLSLNATRP